MSGQKHGEKFSVNLFRFNIFQYRKGDGVAYTFFYIVFPVIMTLVSLLNVKDSELAMAYCYLSIFISIGNCIYDASGRCKKNQPILNRKLAFVIVINVIIGLYCLFEIIMILNSGNTAYRRDWILAFYLLAVIVPLVDCFLCFYGDLAIKTPIDKVAE